MGRAIVRDPKAFLMDEPLSNLDAKLRVQMRTEVSRLQADLGTTTVYVTHDQTEAMTLGDRVAVMRAGVLQQVGTPADLYDNPTNLFVAGFIGSPAMNFMPGKISGDSVEAADRRRASCRRVGARGERQRDRRRAARELRGRVAGRRREATAARRSAPRSTSSSRWARRSTPTSRSSPRASSRRSSRNWRATRGWTRCPAAAPTRWSRGSTRRARPSAASRWSYGST